jgi:hypothetical protein
VNGAMICTLRTGIRCASGSEAPWPRPPAILAAVDELAAALERFRAKLVEQMPPATVNGAGDTLSRLRATAVELGVRISGDDRVAEQTSPWRRPRT